MLVSLNFHRKWKILFNSNQAARKLSFFIHLGQWKQKTSILTLSTMHILVFGATGMYTPTIIYLRHIPTALKGAIGSIFCDIALEAEHSLTLFVRNQGKVPPTVADDKRVTIIEGTLEDEEILNEVSRCEADIFVSFAGPPVGNKGTVWKIFQKMLTGRC